MGGTLMRKERGRRRGRGGAGVGVARGAPCLLGRVDVNKPLTLEGKLVRWEMINPHSWFHIEVTEEDGTVVPWQVEGGSPNELIRNGVTQNSVEVGTVLTIEGYRAKDGTEKAVGRNFVLADGSRLFLGGSGQSAGAER